MLADLRQSVDDLFAELISVVLGSEAQSIHKDQMFASRLVPGQLLRAMEYNPLINTLLARVVWPERSGYHEIHISPEQLLEEYREISDEDGMFYVFWAAARLGLQSHAIHDLIALTGVGARSAMVFIRKFASCNEYPLKTGPLTLNNGEVVNVQEVGINLTCSLLEDGDDSPHVVTFEELLERGSKPPPEPEPEPVENRVVYGIEDHSTMAELDYWVVNKTTGDRVARSGDYLLANRICGALNQQTI